MFATNGDLRSGAFQFGDDYPAELAALPAAGIVPTQPEERHLAVPFAYAQCLGYNVHKAWANGAACLQDRL